MVKFLKTPVMWQPSVLQSPRPPLARGSQYAANKFSETALTLKVKVIGLVRLTTTGETPTDKMADTTETVLVPIWGSSWMVVSEGNNLASLYRINCRLALLSLEEFWASSSEVLYRDAGRRTVPTRFCCQSNRKFSITCMFAFFTDDVESCTKK